MSRSFFVSDLHGSIDRYKKLFELIKKEIPDSVFIGGDILPSGLENIMSMKVDFLDSFIIPGFRKLKEVMGGSYPRIFIILGNDDGKFDEPKIKKAHSERLWDYVHNGKFEFNGIYIYGYSYIPPTPFLMKDWEKYDVSRFADPGCISPEEGRRSVNIEPNVIRYSTIAKDLEMLFGEDDLSVAVILFHSPPYKTNLDRAALDGMIFDNVPLDVHVGSIAIKNMIEEKQPRITLHGHIHESARITGSWKDKIGNTCMFSAAHDGKELSVVKFDINDPCSAVRILL